MDASIELAGSLSLPAPGDSLLDLPLGLHPYVPADVYHQRVLGVVSAGAATKMLESAASYRQWIADGDDGEMEPENKTLSFGSVAHCFALEPSVFDRTYVWEPDFGYTMKHDASGTTKEQGKANKDRRDAWRAERPGATFIKAQDHFLISGMRDALARSKDVGKYFRMLWDGKAGVFAELTGLWECPDSGLLCKKRDDLFVGCGGEDPVILDIKTCRNCREFSFNRARAEYGYHRTVAHYTDGASILGRPIKEYILVAIEKKPPFLHQVYTLSQELIEVGRQEMLESKETLARCLMFDDWPGLSPGKKELQRLPWESQRR